MPQMWRLKARELSVLLDGVMVAGALSLTAVRGFFTSRISQGVRAASGGSARGRSALESPVPSGALFHRAHAGASASGPNPVFSTAIFQRDSVKMGGALNEVKASYPLRGTSDRRMYHPSVSRATTDLLTTGEVGSTELIAN